MDESRWYVLHAYSGYEKKVAESIMEQSNKLGISQFIDEVSVPTQKIVEVKRGTRVNTERKFFPGYVLVQMEMEEATWHLVKKIPKVLGFIGGTTARPARGRASSAASSRWKSSTRPSRATARERGPPSTHAI